MSAETRYWIHHPLMPPWARAFVSGSTQMPGGTACTLLYTRAAKAGTEEEGAILTLEYFQGDSRPDAVAQMKAWITDRFGEGVRMKPMAADEVDWR